jgi:hypothetical protein
MRLSDFPKGTVVRTVLWGNCPVNLVVQGVDEDIKDGRPGVHGYIEGDPTDTRWCYLWQIQRILPR